MPELSTFVDVSCCLSEPAPALGASSFGASLADKAFDGDELRAELDRRGVTAVIPPKANRKQPTACDLDMYKWRHLVENFFAKLKQFRRVATRYEKTARTHLAVVTLAATVLWLR